MAGKGGHRRKKGKKRGRGNAAIFLEVLKDKEERPKHCRPRKFPRGGIVFGEKGGTRLVSGAAVFATS